MYVTELFEDTNSPQILVVYPGRFQPWHKGHKAVYDYLVQQFGRDHVFIATSNKVDPPRSPFSFTEKVQFMNLTGVSSDKIVETRDPYKAIELVQNYNPKLTRLIFAVSEKDMAEDPRFKFGYKKDGSPTYLQAIPSKFNEMQPFEHHGYVMTVPTFQFTVLGQPMRSATEVRAQFAKADDKTQHQIVVDLFGSYDPEVHRILKSKLTLTENDNKFLPPGASMSQSMRIAQQTKDKLDPNRNKFIWKKPGQIGGSFTEQQLLDKGFRRSQFGGWGGTQEMWNRLLNIRENLLDKPTPTPLEIMRKYNIDSDEMIKQIKLGIKTELEHTNNSQVAYEIALDHLNEKPDYYTALTKAGLEESNPKIVDEEAAGVGVIAQNKKMAQDRRYSTSMTQDVKPGTDKKNMRALRLIK